MKLIKKIYKLFDKKIIVPVTKLIVGIGRKFKKINKPLEVLSKSKSATIVISLLFAGLFCYYIQERSNTLLETNAKVLYNQPVTAIYNEEEYVVEGLPETVDITMIGTKANLYLANQLPSQAVSVDLRDLGVGFHQVDLKYKQAITSVEYKLDPSTVRVNISPKQSMTTSITDEVLNLEHLNSEYSISSITLSANEVIVKSTEARLAEVAVVKALIDVDELTDPHVGENNLKKVPVVAYDKDGKQLDVEIVPSEITAVVNIESPSKVVPVVIVPKGIENIVFGKAIAEIDSSIDSVTIYGNQEVLDGIDNIEVEIDVTDLDKNKKYTKTIKRPKDVRKLSENTVTVEVKLGDSSEGKVSNVKLSYRNLGSDYLVQAANDSINELPVLLKGVDTVISGISASDVEAYVDLKGLEEGEHEVDIKVTGSDKKVIYTPQITTAKIVIIKK